MSTHMSELILEHIHVHWRLQMHLSMKDISGWECSATITLFGVDIDLNIDDDISHPCG